MFLKPGDSNGAAPNTIFLKDRRLKSLGISNTYNGNHIVYWCDLHFPSHLNKKQVNINAYVLNNNNTEHEKYFSNILDTPLTKGISSNMGASIARQKR